MNFNLNHEITVELTPSGMRTWMEFFIKEKDMLQSLTHRIVDELPNVKLTSKNKLRGQARVIFGIFGNDLQELSAPFNMNIKLHLPLKVNLPNELL